MRVVIFDGILETHVASSLERAFKLRGHEVLNTGKFGHGFQFADEPKLLKKIDNQIDEVIAFNADLVFVFRPATLPLPFLEKLKRSGAKTMAWLSDDPVLWKLSYGPVIGHYDYILHCGSSEVLDFYQKQHLRPTGVNFPFWTDNEAFPYVYGAEELESDVLFLGNVHDQVRRNRYYDLGALDLDLRIHGNAGQDYFGIWGGYLDSDREVIDAGARSRLAINIPQFFKDHKDLPTWFDGLDKLGSFQYPSRVIQYAAMGLPIVSVQKDQLEAATLPEMRCISSMSEAHQTISELLDQNLNELSLKTHARFLTSFSAKSRVLAIESLLKDDSWLSLNLRERTDWFAEFDGSDADFDAINTNVDLKSNDEANAIQVRENLTIKILDESDLSGVWQNHLSNLPVINEKRNILVIGTGWTAETSQLLTIVRALRRLGNDVVNGNPFTISKYIKKDPLVDYSGIIQIDSLISGLKQKIDCVIFVGGDYIPSPESFHFANEKNITLINLGNQANAYSPKVARLVSLMHHSTFLNMNVIDQLELNGVQSIEYLPELFDASYVEALIETKHVFSGVTVVADKSLHIAKNRSLVMEFRELEQQEFVYADNRKVSIRELANALRSSLIFVLPDTGKPGPLPHALLGHALISGGLVVLPRAHATTLNVELGTQCVAIAKPGEFAMKMQRMSSSTSLFTDTVTSAVYYGLQQHSAEIALSRILPSAIRNMRKIRREIDETSLLKVEESSFGNYQQAIFTYGVESIVSVSLPAHVRSRVDSEVVYNGEVVGNLKDGNSNSVRFVIPKGTNKSFVGVSHILKSQQQHINVRVLPM